MASISVLISSGGRKQQLAQCLESLRIQNHPAHEVFIALPESRWVEIDQYLCRKFYSLIKNHSVFWRLVPTSSPQAYEGRNWGLQHATGQILLLLDEDVTLRDSKALERLDNYHRVLPKNEILGGPYLSSPECTAAGRAYNRVAELWLQKHKNLHPGLQYRDLLVAGNLSLKLTPSTRAIRFSPQIGFGGEEEDFLKRHWQAGHSSRMIEELAAFHNARHDLKTFYSRAWLHGYKKSQTGRLSFKDLEFLIFEAGQGVERWMVYSYLFWNRTSTLTHKHLKHLQTVIPGR